MQTAVTASWKRRLYDTYVSSGQAGHQGESITPEQLFHPRKAYVGHLITHYLPQQRDSRIADLGCGHGALLYFLSRAGYTSIEGVDTSPEQIELLSLMQLVTGDFRMPEPGACDRPADALPAQLIGEGTIMPVEVRHTSAAALLVAAAKPMTPGERAIVRMSDAISAVEFALPCVVAWVYDASPCIMALVVDGIPTRSELDGFPGHRVAHVLSLGRQVRLVG